MVGDTLSILSCIRSWFSRKPIRLAIVRRYQDANGSYVGELYLELQDEKLTGYAMIGASLDTLPLYVDGLDAFSLAEFGWTLDTRNDFLAPMMPCVVRVGAFTPDENAAVRDRVARLPRRRMLLTIQNRFVEDVKAVQEKR